MRYFGILTLFMLFCLAGCGASSEEEAENAIQGAVSELTRGNCNGAISKIESVPYQSSNIRFVKTYASAYACRAGYSTPKFFVDDLPLIGNPSLIGSFSRFSTSFMNEPKNDSYMDLLVATEALLYAGGIPQDRDPTVQRRIDRLGAENVKDLHSQLLYLLLVQLGKYSYFYGQANAAGESGGCFLDYDGTLGFTYPVIGAVDIDTYLTLVGGACSPGDPGNPDLSDGLGIHIERTCQGLVIFNAMMEVLPEVIASLAGNQLNDLAAFLSTFNDAKTSFDSLPSKPHLVLSQKNCMEKYTNNAAAQEDLQIYFAVIFEGLFP